MTLLTHLLWIVSFRCLANCFNQYLDSVCFVAGFLAVYVFIYIYLYVPSYPKKYLFHHVIYIYRHRIHPTSRGVATVLGPLNGLSVCAEDGLEGDKP